MGESHMKIRNEPFHPADPAAQLAVSPSWQGAQVGSKLGPMSTIKEVARRAGVSVGTVSNVLRGSATVNPEIRERVDKIIQQLDYHPNHSARSLKTSQTHLLGMVISDITNPFFPQLARGAEDAAIKHGYLVVASNTDDQVDREKRVLSVLRARRVDGILLVVAPNHGDFEHIEKVIASKIPIVCLDRIPRGLAVSSVTTDALTASEMCVRHLIAMGHRRIAIINGDMELGTACERLQGYKNALEEAKLPIHPELIKMGDFRTHSGYVLAKQLLLSGKNPTAIFVTNGMMGLGALRAIKELGLQCPGDIALAVFDGVPGNGCFGPEVTSVVQPAYQIGYQGVELLLRNREAGELAAPTAIRLEAELCIGESTLARRPAQSHSA